MVTQLVQARGSDHTYDDTSQERTGHRAVRRRCHPEWQAFSAARKRLVGQQQGRAQALDRTFRRHTRWESKTVQSGGISNAKALLLFSDSANCTPEFVACSARSKCPGNDGTG